MSDHPTPAGSSKAFTILELLVVVLIIGILMVLSVVWYLRSSEQSKASQATSELTMLGTANRGYSLDHRRVYAAGAITNACNSASCVGNGTPCDMVACGYVKAQDWNAAQYTFLVLNPSAAPTACNLSGFAGTNFVACAKRKVCGAGVTTSCVSSSSAYATWGYLVDTSGVIAPAGGAPALF